MMKATTYDRVMFWKMLHFGASYLSIALIGMHIGLYWNFIMNMFKKIFKIKESNSISKILVNSVVIIVLILGIYTTYRTEYFTKVTNTLTYVAQHIKPPRYRSSRRKWIRKRTSYIYRFINNIWINNIYICNIYLL